MKKYINWILGLVLLGTAGCTSLSEGSREPLPPDPAHTERVPVNSTDNTQLRKQMDRQSSEINRKRNIEDPGRNEPATTPPELRPQQLPNAPVDTTRHRIYRPLPTRKPVNN
jgi:hypothetical protein